MIFLIVLRYLHLYYVKAELIGILDITKKMSMYVHISVL